ncbi:glycosyltransferase [Kiritimatiellaeota bacterium B1221]|nr:glycosyltransferase [Kiritimatiellaeota bacterium B1221]
MELFQIEPQKAFVSVCIITYNQVSYIRECIESVLMQKTDFLTEIVIGEDDSSDGTREICQEYAEKFPEKIRLFLRDRKDVQYINNTPTGRYNSMETRRACRGKYIAYCEGDDYWTDPHKLQKQFDYLEDNTDCAVCGTFVKVLGSTKGEESTLYDEDVCLDYLHEDFVREGAILQTCSIMVRVSDIPEFPEWTNRVIWGDWCLFLLVTRHGKKAHILPEECAVYRMHGKGTYSGATERKRGLVVVSMWEELVAWDRKRYLPLLRDKLGAVYPFLALCKLQVGEIPQFFKYSILATFNKASWKHVFTKS